MFRIGEIFRPYKTKQRTTSYDFDKVGTRAALLVPLTQRPERTKKRSSSTVPSSREEGYYLRSVRLSRSRMDGKSVSEMHSTSKMYEKNKAP